MNKKCLLFSIDGELYNSLTCWTNRNYILKSADTACLLQSDDSTAGGIAYADTTVIPFSVATHGSAKYEFIKVFIVVVQICLTNEKCLECHATNYSKLIKTVDT